MWLVAADRRKSTCGARGSSGFISSLSSSSVIRDGYDFRSLNERRGSWLVEFLCWISFQLARNTLIVMVHYNNSGILDFSYICYLVVTYKRFLRINYVVFLCTYGLVNCCLALTTQWNYFIYFVGWSCQIFRKMYGEGFEVPFRHSLGGTEKMFWLCRSGWQHVWISCLYITPPKFTVVITRAGVQRAPEVVHGWVSGGSRREIQK